jgi:hypothetical protein
MPREINIPIVWILLLLPVAKHAYKQFRLTALLDLGTDAVIQATCSN